MNKFYRIGFALSFLVTTLTIQPVAGQSVWNVTNGNWNTAGSWSPSGVPVSSDSLHLRFNAASGSYTSTNNIGAMTLNRLTVNNTGTGTITLAGVAANALTFAGTNPTLDITGTTRYTGTFAGSATITKIGTGNFIHDGNSTDFTGTIIINAGRFSNWGGSSSSATLTNNFNPVAIIVNNGGVYQFGNAGIGDPNLATTTYITLNEGGMVDWQEGQALGGLHLLGGNLDLTGGSLTGNGTSVQNWTHGTITGNAYTGAAYVVNGSAPIEKTTNGTVTLSGPTSITSAGGIHLKEGRIIMSHALNLGNSTLHFGGEGTTGTLEYRGATATRSGALNRATGGTGVIEVTEATTLLTLSGVHSGSGLLQKTGAGTLNLTGALGATGITQVVEGTLRVPPGTASGAFIVDPGTTLAVNVGNTSTTFALPTLVFEDGATLNLELNRNTLPTQTLVNVTNYFGMYGALTLNVTNAQTFATGTYTLLDYTGYGIDSGIDLKLSGRTLGELIYDFSNTRIQLQITGADSLKWTGGINGVWDIGSEINVGGTQNWQLITGGTATNFIQTDNIRFDDTATRFDVQLNSAVSPTAMTVTGATNYSISGTGKITGTTSLAKTGTSILSLATDNDYTGGTTISGGGGILLGNGGTTGSVGGTIALTGGVFGFNRSADFVFDNTITLSGSNTLRQNGTGTATVNSALSFNSATLNFDGTGTWDQVGRLTGNASSVINKNGTSQLNILGLSSFSGTLNINGGVVQLTDRGAGGDLNAPSIVINNGGTFIFGPDGNPDLPSATMITVNTGGLYEIHTGESYGGIILNGGEYRAVSSGNTGVNTGAEAGTLGRVVYDFRSGRATTAITGTGNGGILNQSAGGVFAKTTSGTVTIESGVTFSSSLDVQIKEGILGMVSSAVPTTGTAVVTGGAIAGITLGGTGTQGTLRIDGPGTPSSSRAITLTGNGGVVNVVEVETSLTFTGAISGNAPLVKTGLGTLSLQGALNSTALTTASAGTLRLKPGIAAGGFAVETGAVLAIANTATPATMILPSLTLADASMLQFEMASSTAPSMALMQVTDNNGFTLNGSPVIRLINSQPFSNGLFTLLDYSGTAISSGLTLRFEGRTSGNLVYDTANTQIQVNITGTDSVKWTGGVNSVWDTGTDPSVGGTFNWQLVNAGTATNFIPKDITRFDDTATTRSVQIPGTVSPLSVTVDANNNYTFTGAGKISGTAVLSKTGTGTLILATANDYTGGTVVTGGTLQLGNGGTTGSVTGAISLTDSTLAFNRSDTFTFNNALTLNGTNTIKQIGSGVTMNFNSVLNVGTNTLNIDVEGIFNMNVGIDGTGIVNKNGSGHLYLLGNNNFSGQFNINGGIVQLTDRGASGDLDSLSIVVNNTGTFIFGPDGNPDLPNTFITINEGGRFEIYTGESYGGFILNGGTYHATATSTGTAVTPNELLFDLRSGQMTTSTTAAINQSGGGWVVKTTSGTVTVAPGITFTNATPIRFQEGTLAMPIASLPTVGSAIVSGGPLASFDFGSVTTQGTLQIQGGGSTTSSRHINLATGGGRVDIVEAGTTLTFTGVISGDGPLVKAGAGELNLNGALNSTGVTTVEGGVLRLTPTIAAGGFATQSGGTLALATTGNGSMYVPTLSLAGGSTLRFELSAMDVATAPLIDITNNGGLTLNGAGQVVLSLSNTETFASGTYTLLDYTGPAITSGFALQLAGRDTGSLIYDTTSTSISASITQGESVTWKGNLSNVWNAGTAIDVGGSMNWVTSISYNPTNFIQTDRAYFDDTAYEFLVNLTGDLKPNEVRVDATADYFFEGTGSFSGSGRLIKANTGSLFLTSDHTYTGGTTITGGVLQLGMGGTSGGITGNITLDGGALVINRSNTYTLANNIEIRANTGPAADAPGPLRIIGSGDVNQTGVISGSASHAIQMDGTGTLYLKQGNSYSGTTVINSGTVSVAGNTALGSSTADVYINGGTLQLTASNLGSVANTGRTITVGPNGATFDFAVTQNFSGNGFTGTGNVIKTGVGRWGLGSNASSFTGEILIAQGSLLMTSAQLNRATMLSVADGAQFIIDDDAAGTWSLAGMGKFHFSGDGGGEGALRQFTSNVNTANNTFTTIFDREFVLHTARTLISTESVNGTLYVNAIVSGEGGLAKQGVGVLRLGGNGSTYTGGTVVEAGTLWISNTAGSGTGTGSVLIKNGASLIGTGDIAGDTTIQSGGRIQGGTAANRGNFDFLAGLTLESGSLADFRLLADNATDRLTSSTLTIEAGSILRLYLGYTPEAGHTFNILDWTHLGSGNDSNWVDNLDFSNAILPDYLGWDTSLFNSHGILGVVTLVPEPSRLLFLALGLTCLIFRRRRS